MIKIFDGNNLINRFHFAVPMLHTQTKLSTGGIFGCINTVYKLFNEREPNEYFIFAWDSCSAAKKEILPDYKGSRVANIDIGYQKTEVKKAFELLDIQQYEIYGQEADDVIATLAKRARKLGHKVQIFSQDHDFEQLISKFVTVVFPKGGGKSYVKDVEYVWKKYGITPPQLKEVMKLTGDGGDDAKLQQVMIHTGELAPNEKFVGIGPKTAVKLIQANGSVKNILRNIDEALIFNNKGDLVPITRTIAEKLHRSQKAIKLMDKLVILNEDLPIDFFLRDTFNPKWKEFKEFLIEFEFNSILKKLDKFKEACNYDIVL